MGKRTLTNFYQVYLEKNWFICKKPGLSDYGDLCLPYTLPKKCKRFLKTIGFSGSFNESLMKTKDFAKGIQDFIK